MLLRIGEIHQVHELPDTDPRHPSLFEVLSRSMLVAVATPLGTYSPRAFGFLYDLVTASCSICRSEEFLIYTEDGLRLHGNCTDGVYDVSIGEEYRIKFTMTTAEMLITAQCAIADILRSLERSGVDGMAYIRKTSPMLF